MKSGPLIPLCMVLLLALPAASYWFMFKKMDANLVELEAQNRAKQEEIANYDRVTAEIRDLPAEIEKLRKAISFFESKLPEAGEMDKVLREIWTLAEKNGLNAKSVRNMKVIPSAGYCEQPIKMVIVGPFKPGFCNFIKAVESLPRITKISEMQIDKDMKNEGQMTAELTLSIYFESGDKGKKVAGL